MSLLSLHVAHSAACFKRPAGGDCRL